jgi:transposase
MHKDAREELDVRLKLVVLELADHFGVRKTCNEFNVPRSTFYRWKKKYHQEGRSGLYRNNIPLNCILYLHFRPPILYK